MEILVVGKNNTITRTISEMLTSVDGWNGCVISATAVMQQEDSISDTETNSYDLVIVNLNGISEPSLSLIRTVSSLCNNPLLVCGSYHQQKLISPLLDAGANGYFLLGAGEKQLFEAIKKVASGNRYIFAETT